MYEVNVLNDFYQVEGKRMVCENWGLAYEERIKELAASLANCLCQTGCVCLFEQTRETREQVNQTNLKSSKAGVINPPEATRVEEPL